MPLSDHEQRILDEIERRLAEEDPRLVESVRRNSLTTHLLRKIRWGIVAFAFGFAMLLLFFLNQWAALAGFVVMLTSSLTVYHYLRRMGRDQLRPEQGGSLAGLIARLADRMRHPRDDQS